jgi:hypothetical protein
MAEKVEKVAQEIAEAMLPDPSILRLYICGKGWCDREELNRIITEILSRHWPGAGAGPEINSIIHRAVDKCNPTSDGERFCLYGIIENAIKEALASPLSGDGWVAVSFKCQARAGNMGANDPQECNWPMCGCDPYADKVIAALQECDALKSPELNRPGRTKLLIKFWAAMHFSGFATGQEWEAQQKITIADLQQLMERRSNTPLQQIIGGLLDAWDHLPNDVSQSEDLAMVQRYISQLWKGREPSK